jgi:hypothetical protein
MKKLSYLLVLIVVTFIFASLREFQINPRMTTIHFRGEVPSGLTEEMFRHFRAVEFI